MPAHRTAGARRGVLAGTALAVALTTGAAPATAAPLQDRASAAAQLQDQAPAVATRGVPVERLPEPTPEPEGVRAGPVLPAGSVPLGIAVAVLVVLVLRQRRVVPAGPSDRPDGPLPTGTPALLRALSTALADGGDVGLVLLRVEARPDPDGAPSSRRSAAAPADAVLEALDVVVPLVASQVAREAREVDRVVRLGVNRLAVVLSGSGPGEAQTVAQRLQSSLSGAGGPRLSVAAGSAGSPADGTLPAALHRAAERSLRAAAVAAS